MSGIGGRLAASLLVSAVLSGCGTKSGDGNLQGDLDRIITECGYKGKLTFEVHADRSIAIANGGEIKPPSAQEIDSFDCVLTKLHDLPGVTVGIVGNEIDLKEEK